MGAPARLFFALWPDERVRRELAAWAHALHRETGGRVTRADSIHLTLLFLGEVEAEDFDRVRELGTGVSASAFDLSIDTAGCWKHNRIAWAAPAAIPQPLAMLAEQLSAGGGAAGFEPELRPYKPHVTLLRKAQCRPLQWTPSAPIEWRVERFVLVRSILHREGAIYEEMAHWPLRM
ncbi:MAG: RNA 2',3'-cyclic phosphodiesterase [Burkholderiales bacterium]